MSIRDNSWIPFHIVACTSEEYGTHADLLSTQDHSSSQSWQSARTASFPIQIILRFHYRSEINHLLIASKQDQNVPDVEFQIGDGLAGSFTDCEYRKAGSAQNLYNKPVQVPLLGIGTYLKLVIKKQPKRSPSNPFGQVSLAVLKVWGRYTNYLSKIKNEEIPETKTSDKSNVDKILIDLGIPMDLMAWFDEDARNYEHAPIDDDTRITLKELIRIREESLQNEDFEGLQQLGKDTQTVFEIGQEIWSTQRELKYAIAKEDFSKAIFLQQKLRGLQSKRDSFDALYQTSRYESMVVMNRPTSARFQRFLDNMNGEEDRIEQQRRRKRELENQKAEVIIDKMVEEVKQEEPELKPYTDDDKQVPWWEQNQGQDIEIIQKKNKKEKKPKQEEVIEVNFQNPFAFNQGDVDLEEYLKPKLANAGSQVPEIPAEVLRRLHNLGYLNVFGAQCWTAVHSENWRHRQAAAQAVLDFIEMPLLDQYLNGKSKKLFLAAMEMAQISCLKLLSTALAPPVCGTDVSPAVINKVLIQFAPILIEKISELNLRARDISLHTLLSIYRHPAASIGDLIAACLKICIEDPNFPSLFTPPDQQPQRIMLSRLQIVLNIIQDTGYDEREWNWIDVFNLLCVPCLFHPSNDVRMVAIEIIVALYQIIGEDVREAVVYLQNLKQNLHELIFSQMDQLKDQVPQQKSQYFGDNGVGGMEKGNLTGIQETDSRDEGSPRNLNDSKLNNNSGVNGNKSGVVPANNPSGVVANNASSASNNDKQPKQEGIILCMDAIINVPEQNSFYMAIISLNPPAPIYKQQGKVSEHTRVVGQIDMESRVPSPHYVDQDVVFESDVTKESSLIIEIRQISFNDKDQVEFLDIGWTALGVYLPEGQLASAEYQLPLIKGSVKSDIIEEISKSGGQNPWSILELKLKDTKNPIKLLQPTSVIVRLYDANQSSQIKDIYNWAKLNVNYVPKEQMDKYKYDQNVFRAQMKNRTYSELVKKPNSAVIYQQKLKFAANQLLEL